MKYFSKIFLVMLILLIASFAFCTVSRAENTTTEATQTSQTTGQITPSARVTSGSENEIFAFPNVLNIILIAVGIVLILLSIAIFTRLKR